MSLRLNTDLHRQAPIFRAVPVMVYPDEHRAKADSSATLRNDKQIGLQQFGNWSKYNAEEQP